MPARPRLIATAAAWTALALAAWPGWAADQARPGGEPRPISIRLRWGGGAPRAWSGRISLADPAAGPVAFSWKTLGTEPDAAATAHEERGVILLHQPRPFAADGIELTVADWRQARLAVQIEPSATGETAVTLDVPLATVLAGPVQRPLDADGNRLTVETAPGDALRATLLPATTGDRSRRGDTALRRPGDVVRFQVDPLLSIKPGEGEFELRIRLGSRGDEKPILTQTAGLAPLATPPTGGDVASGRVPTSFERVEFQVPLPPTEGVYEIALEAVERGGLRWTRPLASRTLQVVALADTPPATAATADWAIVYELDPGSPKLHERLRRLPGRGLPAMPVPDLALPTMPLPSLSRARAALPRLPEMTGLPEVPLPNVAAMVPRLSGLLATGHSVVVPHQLGPMLRLPAAARPSEPTWEGIVVAAAQPGRPHLVEIDHPLLHRATVVACVLESDATGTVSEVRHAGGFEVTPPADAGTDRLGTHRFVFWPTTRNPLLVIANPSGDGPALVGRVRILAGPERLPAAPRDTPTPLTATRGRSTFAVFAAPDLHRRHGGAGQVAATGGLPFADWSTHLSGIRHSADALAAGGLAGGVIPVYADGAAIWPSRLTREATRWDPAATGDAGLDPQPKDLLGAVALLYGREQLAMIPAFTFNAAIPALEHELVGATPAGIACVGADGRPRRLAGGVHYNILDPRVQAAVEAVIVEAGERLAGEPAVAGLALVLPHDGWLHLPGLAWGLDDATFGRFAESVGGGQPSTGPERFAERARLVAGPLREAWLAWRGRVLGDFYARLAARVAACDSRWPVYLVPTTLATADEIADRFRPSLDDRGEPAGLLGEFGLVTGLPGGGAGRLVFMAPHVQAPGAGLRERATVTEASRALALADADRAGDRRGAVIASRPLPVDLSAVVPHGPFATATPPGPCEFTVVTDDEAGDRGLAMALVASDAEVVFDMRAAVTLPRQPPAARRSFESLPADGMHLAPGLPAPLVVRTAAAGGTTRIAVVNAGPAAARAVLALAGSVSTAIDATDGAALPLAAGPVVSVPLPPWGVRSLVVDGGGRVAEVSIVYDDAVRTAVAGRIDRLRQRLAVLEAPGVLDVLDNPGFELGLGQAAGGGATITGWELVEPRRGSLELVAGLRQGDRPAAAAARGLSFTSRNGLSTLRSNPFPPPATGRISVAAWLRIAAGDPQPPLRIAIEAVEAGREYYRFASVGGLAGGRPLSSEWSLFVLQVDDLPTHAIESLRVRFDLLGPGGVQIDDVRVCDLAFDAAQRGRLAGRIAALSHRFGQGDVGAALVGLEGHWPEFLETFVDDAKLAEVARRAPEPQQPEQPAAARQGMMDRLRGWWQ